MASLSSTPLSLRLAKRSSGSGESRGLASRLQINWARFGRLKARLESEGLLNRGFGVRASTAEVLEGRKREEEETEVDERPLKVGIVCGGPSAERGISLNSARSVLDHIQGDDLHVSCYYIDCDLNAYAISPAQVSSSAGEA